MSSQSLLCPSNNPDLRDIQCPVLRLKRNSNSFSHFRARKPARLDILLLLKSLSVIQTVEVAEALLLPRPVLSCAASSEDSFISERRVATMVTAFHQGYWDVKTMLHPENSKFSTSHAEHLISKWKQALFVSLNLNYLWKQCLGNWNVDVM